MKHEKIMLKNYSAGHAQGFSGPDYVICEPLFYTFPECCRLFLTSIVALRRKSLNRRRSYFEVESFHGEINLQN